MRTITAPMNAISIALRIGCPTIVMLQWKTPARAGEESGHQTDEDPDQNCVEIEVEDHMYQASFRS